MDIFSIHISRILSWLSTRTHAPIVYAQEEQRGWLLTLPQPYVEFIHATRGSFRLHVGPRTAVMQRGDIALVNAHYGNRADFPSSGGRYECISFNVDGSRELADLCTEPLLEVRQMADVTLVHESYGRVIRQYAAPPTPLRHYRLKAEAMLWLATLVDQAVGFGGRAAGEASRVDQVVTHVQQHYAERTLRLNDLAHVAGVSATHLCRMFRRRTGMSPVHYVEHVRLARAIELLSRTDLSIKQIAYRVGYTDQLYFSRVFRTRIGKSPLLFRKSLIGRYLPSRCPASAQQHGRNTCPVPRVGSQTHVH